jgi:hypothetical protein
MKKAFANDSIICESLFLLGKKQNKNYLFFAASC